MKQTEIGLIPDDWEVKPLGDLAFVTKLAGFEFTAHVKYSDLGKIIALRGLNVRKGFLILDDVKYIDDSNFSKLDRSKLFIDDLLFTYVGTVGNAALVDKDNTYYLAPNVALIRCNKHIYPKYLMYLILSKSFFDVQISTLMSTTSQAALSMTNIRLFKILLPPLAEQQRIAKALSDVDALISTTEKLLQKKKNIKQGAMQELLTGKKRLPGFALQTKSPTYKQTELGPIPEDWEVKRLGEICVINPASSNIIPDEFFYVDLESVSSGKLEKKQKIRRRNAPSRAQRQFEKNDILYQTVRPYQRNNLFVNFDSKNYIASTGYAIIRSNNNVDSHYIYQIIHLNNFVNIILDNCTGTSYPAINPKFLKTIPVIIPKKEEQAAIANVLSCMDKEIETLNTKLEKYRNLKTAMMQQLLTGKIRLR